MNSLTWQTVRQTAPLLRCFLHNIKSWDSNKSHNKVPLLQIFLQDTLQVASHDAFSFFFSASDTKTESLLQLFGHSCWGTIKSVTSRDYRATTERLQSDHLPPRRLAAECEPCHWTSWGETHTHTQTQAQTNGEISEPVFHSQWLWTARSALQADWRLLLSTGSVYNWKLWA